MKVTTFYLNNRRFNALLPLIVILLMAVALALGAFFSDTSPPQKLVIPHDKKSAHRKECFSLASRMNSSL
jgi:hypothetical protein